MVEPPKKYFRLFPGNEVRLKSAYFVTCTGWEADDDGNITCLHCTYDPATKGGDAPDGRKVQGAPLHWVSAATAQSAKYAFMTVCSTPRTPRARGRRLPR